MSAKQENMDQGFYDRLWKTTGHRLTFSDRICGRAVIQSLHGQGHFPGSGKSTLELGCGTGWLSQKLLLHGPVTAIDFSPETIAANARRAPAVDFRCGDITEDLGFRDEFDAVISVEVIEHIRHEDQSKLLNQAALALKSGGILVLTTPNRTVNEALGYQGFQPIEDWLSFDELSILLERQFEIVEMFSVVLPVRSRILDVLWKRLFYPINMTVVQRCLRHTRKGRHIVAVCRKISAGA